MFFRRAASWAKAVRGWSSQTASVVTSGGQRVRAPVAVGAAAACAGLVSFTAATATVSAAAAGKSVVHT